jgi:pyruvate/2-oxoglutarate dehydrogenase complex dihydrolipoamide acyltransferase (E2) component
MKQRPNDYQVVPFPKIRRVYSEQPRDVQRKPIFHGLVEVDVTKVRQALREHKARTGEPLSFTAFIATCLGRAVDEHKAVQAYRKGRNHLILFDEVDVCLMVESHLGEHILPLAYIIRAANTKTFREIHQEIRAAQAHNTQLAQVWKRMHWFARLPTFLRKNPHLLKRFVGTVTLTAIGMFGQGAGWGIPFRNANHPLTITLGGIGEKAGIVDGQIAIREYLCMTLSFDHSIVDGAPAARFTGRLKELIESGYGLDAPMVKSEQAVAPGT